MNFEDYDITLTPTYKQEENKVIVTFEYKEDNEQQEIQKIVLEIVVSKRGEKELSLEFNILEGTEIYYRRLVNQIKE